MCAATCKVLHNGQWGKQPQACSERVDLKKCMQLVPQKETSREAVWDQNSYGWLVEVLYLRYSRHGTKANLLTLAVTPLECISFIQCNQTGVWITGCKPSAANYMSFHLFGTLTVMSSSPSAMTTRIGGGSSSESSNLSLTARREFLTSSKVMWCKWLGT